MKKIIYLIALPFILTSVAIADIEGVCIVSHDVYFFGTKVANSNFTERYGTKAGIDGCNVALSNCNGFREHLDASKYYQCSRSEFKQRYCTVKLIRKQDRVLGIKPWVFKTFKQDRITYGPKGGEIYPTRSKACKAARDKCNWFKKKDGGGDCRILKPTKSGL